MCRKIISFYVKVEYLIYILKNDNILMTISLFF
uniref:Uncharacterized protein n=1 Tax=Siphoviridae sp. ctGz830 TaxID=2827825 RepID=A0A8S5TAE1_9CAUD|nr:MAG TPA: hypothetical protein [Siphoviridae sp. ctGz830]